MYLVLKTGIFQPKLSKRSHLIAYWYLLSLPHSANNFVSFCKGTAPQEKYVLQFAHVRTLRICVAMKGNCNVMQLSKFLEYRPI